MAHCNRPRSLLFLPLRNADLLQRYHTQSPESLFCHVPGFRVVVPRSPSQAKGLLLSSILESKDPVIFMEPKILYRAAIEQVPEEAYTLPLGKAEVLKPGSDLTIISYGRPLYTCGAAIEAAERDFKGISIELIDLRSIYPWDRQTILESVRKTGRAIVVHESMVNYGVGAEVAATIQDAALLNLKAPVKRLGGWTTHTGLAYEKFIFPDVASKCPVKAQVGKSPAINTDVPNIGIYDAIESSLEY
jgi:2-oxoisovalerate dehydrogenase E1 component beta subunit